MALKNVGKLIVLLGMYVLTLCIFIILIVFVELVTANLKKMLLTGKTEIGLKEGCFV